MNDKDLKAFEEFFTKHYPPSVVWKSACQYKQKEIDELKDRLHHEVEMIDGAAKEHIEKLEAENAKLRECVDSIDLFARFWSKVKVLKKNECWDWKSSISPNGYGKLSVNNKPKSAHVLSFTFAKGSIPDGMVIDHICRNRKCVNPNHLRAVSQRLNNIENSESVSAKYYVRTHCKNGHEFNQDNTIIRKTKLSQHRICKKCKQDKSSHARQVLKELEE